MCSTGTEGGKRRVLNATPLSDKHKASTISGQSVENLAFIGYDAPEEAATA